MKQFEELTLDELSEKKTMLEKYEQAIEEFQKDYVGRKIVQTHYGKPINKIYEEIIKYEEENRSYELSPGNILIMYPNIKELHTKKQITCDFSGAIIKPGSLYVNYRPMLKNVVTKDAYILNKTLKVEPGFMYDLPTNVQEIESLNISINLKEDYNGIDCSHLSQVIDGGVYLKKLNRK